MFIPKLLLNIIPKAEISKDTLDLTELSTLHEFHNFHAQGEETRPHRLHHEPLLLPGQISQNAALLSIHGDGFLNKDVLAGFESEARVLVVMRVRCSDVDDVYIRVVDKLFVAAVCFCSRRSTDFLKKLGSAGG